MAEQEYRGGAGRVEWRVDLEDAMLDMRLLIDAFESVACGPQQDGEAPPWLWSVSRCFQRLDACWHAYLEAPVAERGQGSVCPGLSLVEAPQPSADGPGLDAS